MKLLPRSLDLLASFQREEMASGCLVRCWIVEWWWRLLMFHWRLFVLPWQNLTRCGSPEKLWNRRRLEPTPSKKKKEEDSQRQSQNNISESLLPEGHVDSISSVSTCRLVLSSGTLIKTTPHSSPHRDKALRLCVLRNWQGTLSSSPALVHGQFVQTIAWDVLVLGAAIVKKKVSVANIAKACFSLCVSTCPHIVYISSHLCQSKQTE